LQGQFGGLKYRFDELQSLFNELTELFDGLYPRDPNFLKVRISLTRTYHLQLGYRKLR